MAIPSGHILEVAVQGQIYGQTWMNTWTYLSVVWPNAVTAEQAAEAYWNHTKTAYRALMSSDFGDAFLAVKVKDLTDQTGDYAVYGVPTAERAGSRTPPSGQPMPPFVAASARLNVGSRTTRPGSKRFAGIYEADVDTGYITSAYRTLVGNLLAVCADNIVLGAPAATVSLDPCVAKRNPTTGALLAYQLVTSYTIAAPATSQNTRKIGRGY